jgi:hypothetical protein
MVKRKINSTDKQIDARLYELPKGAERGRDQNC